MSIGKLAAVLNSVGADISPPDFLDTLWLAQYTLDSSAEVPSPPADVSHPVADRPTISGSESSSTPALAQTPLHLPRRSQRHRSGGVAADAVATPEAPALTDKLGLSRSLKPLKRRRPSRRDYEMDEVATAQLVAQSGLWIPARRPKRVRWMDLALVVDTDESMVLWQQTVYELRLILEDLGAFRDIRTWYLQPTTDGERLGVSRSSYPSQARSPRELIEPSGNRLIMIFSDCVGERWQTRSMRDLIRQWAVAGPVAIILPLPQRLWEHTSANLECVQLKVTEAGLPNSEIECYRQPLTPSASRRSPKSFIPIPAVELSKASTASWARLVTASGDSSVDESAILVGTPIRPSARRLPARASFSAQELIDRFQVVASPSAQRLATCLAAAPVSISVMRLIQDAILGASDQAAVAEVFLGGLLRALPAPHDSREAIQYDFVEGVRELLLDRLTRHQALSVLLATAQSIGKRVGRSRDFLALVAGDGAGSDLRLDQDSLPFALVAEQVMRRMGPDYSRSVARLGASLDASGLREVISSSRTGSATALDSHRSAAQTTVAEEIAMLSKTATSSETLAEIQPDQPADADQQTPRVNPDQDWRAFSDALARVRTPRIRNSHLPLVCPYCYYAFSGSEILFRCEGDTEAGYEPCERRADEVLRQHMGDNSLLLPTFKPSGRRNEARCTYCRGPSRSQVCPNCHSRLPADFRSTDSQVIALVGSSESGKTAFMTVLIHELRRSIGSQLSSSTMAADATTQDRYARDYEMPLYQDGSLFQRTTHAQQEYIRPLVFRFAMPVNQRFRSRNHETLLSFADSAGEDLVSADKVALMARYLAAADATIIMIDPLQLESVRRQIAKPIALPDQPRAPNGPVESVERVTRLLAAVSKRDVVDKPIAVTISKVDALFDILPADSALRRSPPLLPEFDLADSDEVQDEVQAFLSSNGAEEIHRTLSRRYSHWRYFAVSALGAPPTRANALSQRAIAPHRIADPLLWILSEFDLLPQGRRV